MTKREFMRMSAAASGWGLAARAGHAAAAASLAARVQAVELERAELKPMEPQVVQFRSGIYGDLQPLALCATDLSPAPKPIMVELIPGTLQGIRQAADDCLRICRAALDRGRACVALRPSGRGNGSLFEGYGEADVFEAIAAVRARLAIDPDRISVLGSSMGGAATWFHAARYPDFWSAAAPHCGYCDYTLWEKPGGSTFPMQPWEEFSWIARSAAFCPENLRNVALHVTHGEWDRAVGGGVSVEHSRGMARRLAQLGIAHRYTEVPKLGHEALPEELWKTITLWLLEQRRVAQPDRVSLAVHTLRHNRSHWVAVEEQAIYGAVSRVDARFAPRTARVAVTTENVRRIAFGPLPEAAGVEVRIDGTSFARLDLAAGAREFMRGKQGAWVRAERTAPAGNKRHGLSGPFGDLFIEPTVVVHGQSGSDAENHFNESVATNAVRFFNRFNGGVHRGGILGENSVPIPVLSDVRMLDLVERDSAPGPPAQGVVVDKALLTRANLIFVGNYRSNAALAQLAPRLPLVFGKGRVELGGKAFTAAHLAFAAVFPHPDNRRYVGVLGGSEPDAICWGSHLNLQLLPDYLVFDRARVVDWGFWSAAWR